MFSTAASINPSDNRLQRLCKALDTELLWDKYKTVVLIFFSLHCQIKLCKATAMGEDAGFTTVRKKSRIKFLLKTDDCDSKRCSH